LLEPLGSSELLQPDGLAGSPKTGDQAAQVSPIGYAGKPSLPSKAKAQLNRAGRIVGIRRAIFLRSGPPLGLTAIDVVRDYV
jgi:hypothetical protein